MIDLTGRLLAGRPRAAGHDRSSASSCSMQLYAYVRTYVRTDEGNELEACTASTQRYGDYVVDRSISHI
jgi:hypothetical protein